MTTSAESPRRFQRAPSTPVATHIFAPGQAVRLRDGLWRSGKVYLVTAQLPPIGQSPQYRIRNDDERFERMTTEENLDPVIPESGGDETVLMDKTFATSEQA